MSDPNMPEQQKDTKDSSVEVIVVGLLLAVVLLTGTPVFGNNIPLGDHAQELKAIPVAPEH